MFLIALKNQVKNILDDKSNEFGLSQVRMVLMNWARCVLQWKLQKEAII